MFSKEGKNVVTYFKLADYIVKIILYPSFDTTPVKYWIEKLRREYKSWIIPQSAPINAILEFVPDCFTIGSKNIDSNYIKLFEWRKSFTVRTYYFISHSQFIYILQILVNKMLSNDGVFLHASANCLHANNCGIFLGKSTAGKSTVSDLLHPTFRKITDDTSAIRRMGGHNFLFQLPFDNRLAMPVFSGKLLKYEIRYIFILKKSHNYKLINMTDKTQILLNIMTSLWSDEKIYLKKLIPLLSVLLSECNSYILEFPINKNVLISGIKKDIINYL